MLQLEFDIKLFSLLSLAFIVATITGTLSHESGHYAVAKYLGYSAKINYGYTNWTNEAEDKFIDSAYSKYSKEIDLKQDFPGKEKFYSIKSKQNKDAFWITFGGPFQTMLTGTLGFVFLFFQREKIRKANALSITQWILIFVSLFWLRQLANLITWVAGYFLKGKFSLNGDEIQLALSSGLPTVSIAITTALIALGLLSFIIFKILPVHTRVTFILAGMFGGILGYCSWLLWIGPILLP